MGVATVSITAEWRVLLHGSATLTSTSLEILLPKELICFLPKGTKWKDKHFRHLGLLLPMKGIWKLIQPATVAHTFTQHFETEAGGSLCIWGKPGLQYQIQANQGCIVRPCVKKSYVTGFSCAIQKQLFSVLFDTSVSRVKVKNYSNQKWAESSTTWAP